MASQTTASACCCICILNPSRQLQILIIIYHETSFIQFLLWFTEQLNSHTGISVEGGLNDPRPNMIALCVLVLYQVPYTSIPNKAILLLLHE